MMQTLLQVMAASTAELRTDGNVSKEEYLFVVQGQFRTVETAFMSLPMGNNVMMETM